jgi:hypothetical protein
MSWIHPRFKEMSRHVSIIAKNGFFYRRTFRAHFQFRTIAQHMLILSYDKNMYKM